MIWLYKFHIRSFFKNTIWLIPLLGIAAAMLLNQYVLWIDLRLGLKASASIEGARAILSTLATSMFSCIVFVFSILLLSVQLASAQLTPRIIVFFYRNPVIKFSLVAFIFTFTYTLSVLYNIKESVAQISILIAVYSCLSCIGIFLYTIDHLGKSLRPISLLNLVGSAGLEVIMDVYPYTLSNKENAVGITHSTKEVTMKGVVRCLKTGVVMAFDNDGIVKLAKHHSCYIEFIPQVGDFVTSGDPLFRIDKNGENIRVPELLRTVAIGQERTMEQDPAFVFRIIVDIAMKALSPGNNDPTTAVLALDQIHRLLRAIVLRQLKSGKVHDNSGILRFSYYTPDCNDFVTLAITEIRQNGHKSIQIARRLRALLNDLVSIAEGERAVVLKAEIDMLDRDIQDNFCHSEDQKRAALPDSLGVGGTSKK